MTKENIKKKVVIVIPVHSANPAPYELVAFKQCFNVLSSHPIKLIAPKGLDLIKYQQAVIRRLEVVFINPDWQSSVLRYNKLKMSRFFYNIFKEYEFMLTYELDAFVFKDELLFWCNKNYDYIGAPWFENYTNARPSDSIVGVGNSGFSLRKIDSVINILKNIYYKNPLEYNSDRITLLKAHLKTPFRWLLNQTKENYTVQKNFHYNEDTFFGSVVNTYKQEFKIAPIEDALRFSFEANPDILLGLSHNILPMGCHAWWRYDLNFWKPYIMAFGHKL